MTRVCHFVQNVNFYASCILSPVGDLFFSGQVALTPTALLARTSFSIPVFFFFCRCYVCVGYSYCECLKERVHGRYRFFPVCRGAVVTSNIRIKVTDLFLLWSPVVHCLYIYTHADRVSRSFFVVISGVA